MTEYLVSRCDDVSETGTLRHAVETCEDGTTIVLPPLHFRLTRRLELREKRNVRITAPHGATVSHNDLFVRECCGVLVHNIRFRLGDTAGPVDCISFYRCNGCTISRCSMAWSVDELAELYDCTDCTIDACLMGYPLHNPKHNGNLVHPKGNHGMGPLITGSQNVLMNSLIAHCYYRPDCVGSTVVKCNRFFNFVNPYPLRITDGIGIIYENELSSGPATSVLRAVLAVGKPRIWMHGNVMWDRGRDTSMRPATVSGECLLSSWEAKQTTMIDLEQIGARPRDRLDRRIVRDYLTGTGPGPELIDVPDWDFIDVPDWD